MLKDAYFGALSMLIAYDAASHFPKMWILEYPKDQDSVIYHRQNDMVRGREIWPNLISEVESSTVEDFPVYGILEHLRHVLGDEIDVFKTELGNRMLN
jgi:hypothetical protein